MRIAIPLAGGKLAQHFGHCEEFALLEISEQSREIISSSRVESPEHQPGLLPPWLAGHKVDMIIAGGMGMRAKQLFQQNNIQVVVGASADTPENIVQAYLDGILVTGDNLCDH